MACILVVDDDIGIQELIQSLLEDEGHQIIRVTDGETSLRVARETTPDVIIMDLMLPRRNGISAMRHLRDEFESESTPIIAISAIPSLLDFAERAGATARIEKPFNIEDLIQVVDVELQR